MQRKTLYSILCIFLFLCIFAEPQKVNAQVEYQTFESNPIEYWQLNDITATFNENNTITLQSDLADWYNSSFEYRKEISISGRSGAGTNYAVMLTVIYDSDMQTDFDDLRFTDGDGITPLDYWREDYTASTSALVWVEVADNLDTAQTIYMYYGNSEVDTLSNGENTFLLYEDWTAQEINLDTWDILTDTATEVITYSATDAKHGYVQKIDITTPANGIYALGSDLDQSVNRAGMLRVKFPHLYADYQRYGWGIGDFILSDFPVSYYYGTPSGMTTNAIDDNGNTDGTDSVGHGYEDAWHVYGIDMVDGECNFYVDHTKIETYAISPATDITNPACTWWIRDTEYDLYTDWFVIRKYVTNEPSPYFYSEQSIDYVPYVDIPILKQDSQTIKTFIELNTNSNNESVIINVNTSLGIDTNLMYKIDETFDRTRIEIMLKHAINVYRITGYTETQTFISRNQTSFLLSKNVQWIRMSLYNFNSSSRLSIFYLSGDLNYTISNKWTETIYESSQYTQYASISGVSIYTGASTTTTETRTYSREFDYFQYLRTHVSYIHENVAGTNRIAGGTWALVLVIENYTVTITIDCDTTTGYGDFSSFINIDVIGETSIFEADSDSVYEGNPTEITFSSIKIWRTLENHLGVAWGSDCELFHSEYDTRRDAENEFSYWYSNRTLENFEGYIHVVYDISIQNDGSGPVRHTAELSGFEYEFFSNFPVAEPHFSSFWADLFRGWPILGPFGQWLDSWGKTIDTVFKASPVNVVDEFIDWVGGIGQSVADFLQPAFDSLLTALGNIGETLNDYIGDWGEAAFLAVVDILTSVASAIADFLVWFINGIGALLGITDLAGTIATLISDFATSVTAFIAGTALFFQVILNGFNFAITLIGTYAPIVIGYATIFIVLHVTFTLATMDDTKIMNMASFYGRILTAILEGFYKIVNMIIQFIGGIIP